MGVVLPEFLLPVAVIRVYISVTYTLFVRFRVRNIGNTWPKELVANVDYFKVQRDPLSFQLIEIEEII